MRPLSAWKSAARTAQANARNPSANNPSVKNLRIKQASRAAPAETARGHADAFASSRQNFTLWRALRGVARGELGHRLVAAEHSRRPQQAGEGLELGVVDPHRF